MPVSGRGPQGGGSSSGGPRGHSDPDPIRPGRSVFLYESFDRLLFLVLTPGLDWHSDVLCDWSWRRAFIIHIGTYYGWLFMNINDFTHRK